MAIPGKKLSEPVLICRGKSKVVPYCPRKRDCKNYTGLHYRKAEPERVIHDLAMVQDRLSGMAQMERDVTIKLRNVTIRKDRMRIKLHIWENVPKYSYSKR